jgi:sulfur relay (sulfurtransferase) DsrC/TusE family protein
MKKSRTTLPLEQKDREAIAAIREYYGLHSDADAIRMAIHELSRRVQKAKNVHKNNTLEDGYSDVRKD